MAAPRALWLDWCCIPQRYDHGRIVARFCDLRRKVWPADVLPAVRAHRPDFLCVDYDYPDRARLGTIPLLRRHFPGLRVLMFTEYHTEALAVWAFRHRVWEYRVKPITEDMLARLVEVAMASSGTPRPRGWFADVLPPDLIAPSGPLRRPTAPLPRTAAAVAYVDEHYAEVVRVDTVARLCGLSRSEFSRVFHREHGTSFRRYLVDHRIAVARDFLALPQTSVSQVAYAVGFNDLSHFGRLFRRLVGEPPTRYRQRLQSRQTERDAAPESARAA